MFLIVMMICLCLIIHFSAKVRTLTSKTPEQTYVFADPAFFTEQQARRLALEKLLETRNKVKDANDSLINAQNILASNIKTRDELKIQYNNLLLYTNRI